MDINDYKNMRVEFITPDLFMKGETEVNVSEDKTEMFYIVKPVEEIGPNLKQILYAEDDKRSFVKSYKDVSIIFHKEYEYKENVASFIKLVVGEESTTIILENAILELAIDQENGVLVLNKKSFSTDINSMIKGEEVKTPRLEFCLSESETDKTIDVKLYYSETENPISIWKHKFSYTMIDNSENVLNLYNEIKAELQDKELEALDIIRSKGNFYYIANGQILNLKSYNPSNGIVSMDLISIDVENQCINKIPCERDIIKLLSYDCIITTIDNNLFYNGYIINNNGEIIGNTIKTDFGLAGMNRCSHQISSLLNIKKFLESDDELDEDIFSNNFNILKTRYEEILKDIERYFDENNPLTGAIVYINGIFTDTSKALGYINKGLKEISEFISLADKEIK